MTKLTSARAVIKHFGGNKKFAEELGHGVTRQTVNNWHRDNLFPASAYVLITLACAAAGLRAPFDAFAMRGLRKKRK